MTIAFLILSLIIVAAGLGVVCFLNPINSALCLIANMLAVAGIFVLLDAHFLAVAQMIVYAGAIMVLVIFVLMLLNLKTENPRRLGPVYVTLCTAAAVGFIVVMVPLFKDAFSVFPEPASPGEAVKSIGTVENLGMELYTRFVFPFEAASILIIGAIAGAVMLARRRYTRL